MKEGFSIIMPTYNQAEFIRRAIYSVFEQTYTSWELIIINDGCSDFTENYIKDYLENDSVIYIKNSKTLGKSNAINQGLDIASYKYISYLPSDDFYFKNHLSLLKDELDHNASIVLTYTIAETNIFDSFLSNNPIIPAKKRMGKLYCNCDLQLVQTAHKNTIDRWDNIINSNSYYELFWHKLIHKGLFTNINKLSCHWTTHRGQIGHGTRFENKNRVCKKQKNKSFLKPFADITNAKSVSLKIVILGDLGYNPDRIYAFREHGHTVYGLWIDNPLWSSTGKSLDIINIPLDNWEKSLKEIKPDIIYALLNYVTVPFAHEVMSKVNIPFVWHFKEGPNICIQQGFWKMLFELYLYADGVIYINKEAKAWYQMFLPKWQNNIYIMDGDLPNKKYINNVVSPRKLSDIDGEIHTLASGRLIGLSIDEIRKICNSKIHIHIYGSSSSLLRNMEKENPHYFHLHNSCPPKDWNTEYSQYDAGWLHCFDSKNDNDLIRASWDDLNIPAKMSTMFTVGIPMIQKNNTNHLVSIQSLCSKYSILYNNIDELVIKLNDKKNLNLLKKSVLVDRQDFSFDFYIDELVSFFKKVINFNNE